jgi:CheY-like chemotaxis protein
MKPKMYRPESTMALLLKRPVDNHWLVCEQSQHLSSRSSFAGFGVETPFAGTTFEFVAGPPAKDEPRALTERAVAPCGPRCRILVVEDNRDAAHSLRILLELLGHEVVVAYTGPEGLQRALEWRPDVVLSDIGLPGGLDGWALAKKLRSNPATAKARLIAITGYGSEEDRRHSREAQFDYHLTKPVDPVVLQEVIVGDE